jgi:GAF domain-containing protein
MAAEILPPVTGLASLLAAALVLDERGVIAAVNAEAERLLAASAGDLVGKDAHDMLHRDRHGRPVPRAQCQLVNAFLGRYTSTGDLWFRRGDGQLVELAWLVAPSVTKAGGPGTLVVLHKRPARAADTGVHDSGSTEMPELERLTLLAETTVQLTSTLDSAETLRRLVGLVVPRIADWAVIDLITEADDVERALVVHYEDGAFVTREDLQGPMPPVLDESPMPLSRALRGAASTLATATTYHGPPDSAVAVEQRRLFEATGIHSAAIAPIRGLRDVLGALTLGRSKLPAPLTPADLSLLDDICRRTGLALDNARLYQRQRAVAETMQRHLLPQLPSVPGISMAARYLSAPDASQVGGDWYDAFPLPGGGTALVIGDVVGHDLEAAARMAQVRSFLRAYAWEHGEAPSAVIGRLEPAVMQIAGVPMVTLVHGVLEQSVPGSWQLTWTNAGHPPPLLLTADGQAQFLTGGHGPLLGTGLTVRRPDASVALPPGATLVLYTDGLVENRTEVIDTGLERLRENAASLVHRPLSSFLDLLLEHARPSDHHDDDIAVLALRTPASTPAR